MAHEVGTRPLPPTAAGVEAEAGITLMDRVDGALEGLWHFLSSMRFAVVLMLGLAIVGLIGSLIIQAPPGILAEPEAKANWIAEIGPMGVPIVTFLHGLPVIGAVVPDLRYRDVAGLFDSLQLFGIFNSIYFRIIIAALVISTIACSIHRFPGMVRTATQPRVDVAPTFFEHAPQHEAIVVRHTPAETLELLSGILRAKRYRVLTADGDAIHVYADRFRWAPFAGLIGHLSLVVILAGGIVGATMGYRNTQFTISEGATMPVDAVPGVTIQLLDFTDTYDIRTGAPSDYASQVVLYRDGAEIARHTIRVNDPLRLGDTSFYQAFFGSAAVMTVKDKDGKTLVAQGVPLAWRTTADDRPVGSFTIPGTDYVGWVIGTKGAGDSTIQAGQVQLELYTTGEGTQVGQALLTQGSASTIGGLDITFERESQFTGLNIGRDPGVMLVWLGAFLLFGGFVIRFTLPHKRIWARIAARPNGAVVGVASLGSKEAALGTEFESLVNDIRTALAAPARN